MRPITCPPRIADPDKRYSASHANRSFNNWLRQTYPQVIDVMPVLQDPELPKDQADYLHPHYARDTVHLNLKGTHIMAAAIVKAVQAGP